MDSLHQFVTKEANSLLNSFEPVRDAAGMLLEQVLKFRRATVKVGNFLERLQGMVSTIESMIAQADNVIDMADTVHGVVVRARDIIDGAGLSALADIFRDMFDKVLNDPECTLGYHIPGDWPALRGDIYEIGYTFAELANVNSLQSAMGIPSILLGGLQRVLCMVRRAGATVTLLVDDYIISPMYDLMDLLAVGTWGDSRPPECISDHCLEIAQRSTGLW